MKRITSDDLYGGSFRYDSRQNLPAPPKGSAATISQIQNVCGTLQQVQQAHQMRQAQGAAQQTGHVQTVPQPAGSSQGEMQQVPQIQQTLEAVQQAGYAQRSPQPAGRSQKAMPQVRQAQGTAQYFRQAQETAKPARQTPPALQPGRPAASAGTKTAPTPGTPLPGAFWHTDLKQDTGAVSNQELDRAYWTEETQTLIDQLQQSFPGIRFHFAPNGITKQELSSLAAMLGAGSHLILAEDFLTQMTGSQEAFQQGKNALFEALGSLSSHFGTSPGKGILLQADHKFSWTLSEPQQQEDEDRPLTQWEQEAEQLRSMLEEMKRLQEEARERKEKMEDFRMKTHAADYRTAGSYAKLASAGSKAQVQWVMSEARRKISNLRMIAASGTDEESRKARAAIKSYNTLLMRGGRKIRRLNEEELTRLRREQAEEREREQEALRLRLEQARQKTKRKSYDSILVQEGRLNDLTAYVYQSPHHRRSKYHCRPGDPAPAPSIPAVPVSPAGTPVSEAIGSGSIGGAMAVSTFTPADVTITEG